MSLELLEREAAAASAAMIQAPVPSTELKK